MATPGTLLLPQNLKVGARIQARDPKGFWYDASVIRKNGRGKNTTVTVHYTGFGNSIGAMETFKEHGSLRVRLGKVALMRERAEREGQIAIETIYGGKTDGRREDGTYEIERLLRRRVRHSKVEYLVRWLGWAPRFDTWESENLTTEIIEEFEEEQELAEWAKHNPPTAPFVIEIAEAEEASIRALRLFDAIEMLAHIKHEFGDKLKNQTVPAAEKKFFVQKPVSAQIFYAIHAKFRASAQQAQPARPVETAVEKIATKRGGKRPVNAFGVLDDVLINELLGPEVYRVQHEKNGAAIKVVPPLEFFMRGWCDDETDELLPVKELTIKAHIAALVPNHEHPDNPTFRLDHNAYNYPPSDVHTARRAMAEALLNDSHAGGDVPAEFVAWAQVVLPNM
jgi:hypothetical protein